MNLKTILLSAVAVAPVLVSAANPRHGIDAANLDTAVDPATDFYLYANGGWMQANPLTAEFSRFGMFDKLRENARQQLKDLVLNLSQNPDSKVKGTEAQKVADIYAMGMDSVRLNSEGAAPLKPLIAQVENWDPSQLAALLGVLARGQGAGFFGVGVGADQKNADMNILHVGEGGLHLGDRDYYLEDSENNRKIMEAYKIYAHRMLELAGYDKEQQDRIWNHVIAIETEMARHKMTREEKRNPLNRYNPMTVAELCERYPGIDWKTYFTELGINVDEIGTLNVSSVPFIDFLNNYLPELSWQQIQDYLVFDVITEASNLLSDDFIDANFQLYDRVMSGKEELEPRWKRAMAIPNSMFSEAVGKLYVEKYFPEENKKYMTNLVENLRKGLSKHIDNLTWMSDETKQKAQEKLAGFTVKIGYPDKWKDYSEIQIDPQKSYLENVLAASEWFVRDNLKDLGKPVDKDEWLMSPQTVNAYYMPTTNEICFPAAILQPPYFDPEADDALNYGAIGVVIGHEMTHGFDDSGRRYDKNGNLNDWWTPEDAERFTALADKLVEQFNQVEVSPGVFANGAFTLGENIADQGGLRVALTAYLDSLNGEEAPDIDGFSPLQRFYLAYANVWAGNIREEEILRLTKADPHSLGKNRVNVTLRNLAPFFEAFSVKEGDKMYRPAEERVIIW